MKRFCNSGIERRIFISRPAETTDLDKYANKMFKNDCFNYWSRCRQTVPKLSALAVISEMFASYAFPDKNQKPLRMCRIQITKQAVAILSLISGNATYSTACTCNVGYD